jgi:hypothetical protein
MTQSPTDKLVARWCQAGALPRPGAAPSSLREFEQLNRVILPGDMRDYFIRLDGSTAYYAGEEDERGFSFWPIVRVRRVPEELAAHDQALGGFDEYFFFADFMTWSWAYAIRLAADATTGDSVILIGQEHIHPRPPEVAGSFAEFIDVYLEDSPRLYGSVGEARRPPMST